jgi:hypothetical protein
MNMLDNLFPASPDYKGCWHSILLEPIIGSGERITVLVVAIGNNTEFKIEQTVRRELLDCLYGTQSFKMQNMIDYLTESIEKELKQSGNLSRWTPPFAGVHLNDAIDAADHNIEGMLCQAVRFSSSFGSIPEKPKKQDDNIKQDSQGIESWTKSILKETTQRNASLAQFFNGKVKSTSITYNFLTEGYAANFALLIPNNRLTEHSNMVKVKLFNLEALKSKQPNIDCEIIISTPSTNELPLSDRAINKLNEQLAIISYVASSKDIKVFQATTPKEVVEHLINIAA